MNEPTTPSEFWVASATQVAARPASWPLNDEQSISFFVSTFCFVVLAILAVLARFYARRVKNIAWKLDDYLCLAGLLVYFCHFGVAVWAVWGGGLGHHQWLLTHGEQIALYKQLLVVQLPYALEMVLIRISICVLFIRIFIPKWFRYTMYLSIGLNLLWCLYVFIGAFTPCYPFRANWDRQIPGSYCFSSPILYSIAAGWAVALDLIIWLAPQTVVWKLQMRLADKICVSLIFALGVLDIGISAVRVSALVTLQLSGDFSKNETPSQLWSTVEPGVAIIVACAPMMRVIIEKILPERMMKRVTRQISKRTNSPPSRPYSFARALVVPGQAGNQSNRQSAQSQRRHSEIERAMAAMTPADRPTSNCIAKRVSSDSFMNAFESRQSSQTSSESNSSWWRNEKVQVEEPKRRSWRQRVRWWDWSRQAVRTRSRSISQQFVRVRQDVTVTQDTTSQSPPDLEIQPPTPPEGGGTSTLGGEYGESISWPEMVSFYSGRAV